MDKVQEISVVLVTVAFVGISCTRYPRTSKKYNKYKSNKKRGSYHSASQLSKKAEIMMLVKPKMLMKLVMMLMVMMLVMATVRMIRLTSRSEGRDTQVSPDPSPLTPCRDRARKIDWSLIAVNSLKMANIGELRYGVLRTDPNFGLREEIKFSYVYVLQQRLKKKFMVVFVQVVKRSVLDVQNLLLTLTRRTSSLLSGFIDVCKPLGIRARF